MSTSAAALAAPAGVEGYVRCPPGKIVRRLRRGDIVLICGRGRLGRLIQFFSRIRFRHDRRYAYWSHAAMVVTDTGQLLEVHVDGVSLCSIERYRGSDFCYVRLDLPEAAREAAAQYAQACLGRSYDVGGFLLLALSVVLCDRLRVPDTGKPGCTSVVVRALERAGFTFERAAPEMMPADLAKKFGVLP